MKCAIYARVSRGDRQDNENQLLQLREFARVSGWTIVNEYIDEETGRTADRPAFVQLFEDASRHRFDVVLFWALDRFCRQGALETLSHLRRLTTHGVNFRSFTQQYIDSCGVFRDAVISILAVVAKQEAIVISERTKAGLARARQNGRMLGRPPATINLKRFAAAVKRNDSLKALARDFTISSSTAQRFRKKVRATPRNK